MAISPVQLWTGDRFRRWWRALDANKAPVDITGSSARLEVRDETDSVVFEASSIDGTMVIDGLDGTVTMDEPQALAAGVYTFDARLVRADGEPVRLDRPTPLIVEQGVIRD